MWLTSIIPAWIIHTIMLMGVVGSVVSLLASSIPVLGRNSLPILALSLLLLSIGFFGEGVIHNETAWKLKLAKMEQRALKAETDAAKENVKIVEKIVEKIKVVTDTKVVIQRDLVEAAPIIDQQCVVDPEAIIILNKAAVFPIK